MKIHWLFQFCVVLTLVMFSEYIQHYLVIAGFSWVSSAFLLYFLLFSNCLVSITSIFFQNRASKFFNWFVASSSLTVAVILMLSLSTGKGFQDYGAFSFFFIFSIIALLLLLWLERSKNLRWVVKKGIWKIALVVATLCISIGLSLFVKKPYLEDYEEFAPRTLLEEHDVKLSKIKELVYGNVELGTSDRLVAFVTPKCPHCNRLLIMLETGTRSGKLPLVSAVIGGSDSTSANFIERTGFSGPYMNTMNSELFFSIVDRSVPKVYLMRNDSISRYWNGTTFNYHALDGLSTK